MRVPQSPGGGDSAIEERTITAPWVTESTEVLDVSLLCMAPGIPATRLTLADGAEIVIGRGPDVTLEVDDPRVSRRHTAFVRRGGTVVVRDLGSRNGTMVGADLVCASERAVAAGDTIRIGPLDVVVAASSPPGPRHGGRIDFELHAMARGPAPARATLLVVVGPFASEAIVGLLGEGAILEERGVERAALLVPFELDTARIEAVRVALPRSMVASARFPDDGRTLGELWSSAAASGGLSHSGIAVADPEMRKVFLMASRLAGTTTTVLLLGETGVGKEVVAGYLHRGSGRAGGPYVRLNCASLPETLIEAELFGFERGAFTGATARKIGHIEAASGGTLLLDEIGELPVSAQAKLLRVLETRAVTRLGSTRETPVDIRIVCATHRDLKAEIAAGRFREDLYYRINTFTIRIPPLRERRADVLFLAHTFLQEFARRFARSVPTLSREAEDALVTYAFPGNVRELRNAMEYAAVVAEDLVEPRHLPENIVQVAPDRAALATEPRGLTVQLETIERRTIEGALAEESGNQTRAAKRLGITRRALIYRMEKLGLKAS